MKEVTTENAVAALVNSALAAENVDRACEFLARARGLQKTGKLAGGYGFAVSTASPQTYYARRRELLMERFAIGDADGIPPTLTELAQEFECSLSVVHSVRVQFERGRDAA